MSDQSTAADQPTFTDLSFSSSVDLDGAEPVPEMKGVIPFETRDPIETTVDAEEEEEEGAQETMTDSEHADAEQSPENEQNDARDVPRQIHPMPKTMTNDRRVAMYALACSNVPIDNMVTQLIRAHASLGQVPGRLCFDVNDTAPADVPPNSFPYVTDAEGRLQFPTSSNAEAQRLQIAMFADAAMLPTDTEVLIQSAMASRYERLVSVSANGDLNAIDIEIDETQKRTHAVDGRLLAFDKEAKKCSSEAQFFVFYEASGDDAASVNEQKAQILAKRDPNNPSLPDAQIAADITQLVAVKKKVTAALEEREGLTAHMMKLRSEILPLLSEQFQTFARFAFRDMRTSHTIPIVNESLFSSKLRGVAYPLIALGNCLDSDALVLKLNVVTDVNWIELATLDADPKSVITGYLKTKLETHKKLCKKSLGTPSVFDISLLFSLHGRRGIDQFVHDIIKTRSRISAVRGEMIPQDDPVLRMIYDHATLEMVSETRADTFEDAMKAVAFDQ